MISTVKVNRIPDIVRLTGKDTFLAKPCGSYFEHNDIKVTFDNAQDTLSVSLTAQDTPVRFIQLRWHGEFNAEAKFLGDAVERGYGNLEWRGLVPHRLMPWYFLASDKKETMGFGVKVRPNAFAFWMCDRQGVTLWLDVRCGSKGVVLNGRELQLASIVTDHTEDKDPFDFLTGFCAKMCQDPLLPPTPIYGSNNWYYAYGNSSHEEVLQDARILSELTQGLENRPYMVIDDCWQPLALTTGAAGRPHDHGNSRFPDMARLASEIRALGVRPGIWIRPQRTSEMFLDRRLRCDRDQNYLDITEPEALKLIAEDVNRVTGEWGYEFLKYDFVTFDALGRFFFNPLDAIHLQNGWAWHDRTKTNAEAIKGVYKTILDNSNGAIILGCNVVGHLAAGLVHMHRSGDDTSGHNWDRTVIMGVNTLAFRLAQHKNFFHIDADCVGITENIDWEYNRRFLKLLALSGTPLFASIKPSALTQDMKADLKEAFELASRQENTMKPLDWFETSIPTRYLIDGKEHEFDWMLPHGFNGFSA
ncbi:MAG TPA: alpha-galactosidase [Clostridiales bacterium]|nr:alpha-galactosidase [Clostridiales bacterium]